MSLAIDVDTVTEVLLADGWHSVWGKSFSLDAYEFLWSGRSGMTIAERRDSEPAWARGEDPMLLHGGGQYGICANGFSFTEIYEGEPGSLISGPLTAVLAVRHRHPDLD